jgi:hypothetical protein
MVNITVKCTLLYKNNLGKREALKGRITIFWNWAPCGLVEIYLLSGRAYCLYLQSRKVGSTGKKASSMHSASYLKDGISRSLRNIGELLLDYTASCSRRYYSSWSPP